MFCLCEHAFAEFSQDTAHLLKVGLVKAKTQLEATEQALQAGSCHGIHQRHSVANAVSRLIADS